VGSVSARHSAQAAMPSWSLSVAAAASKSPLQPYCASQYSGTPCVGVRLGANAAETVRGALMRAVRRGPSGVASARLPDQASKW